MSAGFCWPRRWCCRRSLLHAALPTEPDVSGPTSFAGQLLVASPDCARRRLITPSFCWRSIATTARSASSSTGRVMHRRSPDCCPAFGADAEGVNGGVRVFSRRPGRSRDRALCPQRRIQPARYDRYRRPRGDDRRARRLRDIGLGKGPKKSLVAFGYAGWAASQLENELAHGVWVTMPEDSRPGVRRRSRQRLDRRTGAAQDRAVSFPLLPACGEKAGMRGPFRWAQNRGNAALALTRFARSTSPRTAGSVNKRAGPGMTRGATRVDTPPPSAYIKRCSEGSSGRS